MAKLQTLEQKLWEAADTLRGNISSSDYKEVVLGLIFLKFISDSFDKKQNELKSVPNVDPEDRDEYIADNIYWVPKQARLRVEVKRLLREYGYPPDQEKLATDLVLAQANLLGNEWSKI